MSRMCLFFVVGWIKQFPKGKGKKGNFKKNGKQVAAQVKKPKSGPKPELSASTAKGLVTGSGTAPSIWRIRRVVK